jgi:hypothetical protein
LDLVGKTLGESEIIAEVGKGGMGTVYKACYRRNWHRRVALKVPLPTLAQAQVMGMPVYLGEAHVGKGNHIIEDAFDNVLKGGAIVDIGRVAIPSAHRIPSKSRNACILALYPKMSIMRVCKQMTQPMQPKITSR